MHLKDLEQVRYSRLEKIRDLGFDPYGHACIKGGSIPVIDKSSVIENTFNSIGESIGIRSVQGRIILLRDNGKLIWAQVQDELGVIQVAISKKDVRDEKIFQLAKLLDLGDIICASGPVRKTQSGQITIWANDVICQCKSLAHPPDKVDGLKDVETRYRKRYLDMAYNTSVLKNLKIRSKIISQLRKFFTNREFIEVETPMLHAIAGGAAARPFKTHLNALNIPLYLRVAPELYLKRLIVGGMSSIFEINRNFRNEGIDATHNPEFTALEAYAINHDVRSFMGLLHKALTHLAYEIDTEFKDSRVSGLADTSIRFNNHIINMSIFATKNYADLYLQGTGKNLLEQPDFHKANKEFEELCEPLIDPSVPTFVYGYPSAISPLTKVIPEQPLLSQRADLFIGGMEIGTIYTEQNDPKIQFEVFSQQVSDEEESTHRTLDMDFVEALKVGMPPTAGLGIGIDRLVMLFTNQTSVRDVIAFPFMRPVSE